MQFMGPCLINFIIETALLGKFLLLHFYLHKLVYFDLVKISYFIQFRLFNFLFSLPLIFFKHLYIYDHEVARVIFKNNFEIRMHFTINF